MKRYVAQYLAIIMTLVVVSVAVLESNAYARAGGSRSSGSRGSRSYSAPATAPSQTPARQTTPAPRTAAPSPYQQPAPATGGFFRNFAGGMVGGIAGGILGGMLFRSMGFGGGMGGGGYGGPGIFDIILIAGIIYLIYRFIKKKREAAVAEGVDSGYQAPQDSYYSGTSQAYAQPGEDVAAGISHIRQMDYSFDEERFKDTVMDLFFKVQGAWMNRDLSTATSVLTDEMRRILQEDVDKLLRDKQINRLENIAVRTVEVSEAWQESGQDYITTLITANILDYTTDEAGQVISGSKTDPVKFEEYWTFTRPVGANPWKLSAIQQK